MRLRLPILICAAAGSVAAPAAQAQADDTYVCAARDSSPSEGELEVRRTLFRNGWADSVDGRWTVADQPFPNQPPLLEVEWTGDNKSDAESPPGYLLIHHYFIPWLQGLHGKTRLVIRPCRETIGCSIIEPELATPFIGTAGETSASVYWEVIVSVARQWGEAFLIVEDEQGKEVWKQRIGLDMLLDVQKRLRALTDKTRTMAADYKSQCQVEAPIRTTGRR
jgi:hypothetical protein